MCPEGSHEETLSLKESHRRWIGSVTGHMRDLLAELHRAGVAREVTAELEGQIERLERETGARPPERPYAVDAALSSLWIDACELRAKTLRGFGELSDFERRFFDRHASLLEATVRRLREAIAQESETGHEVSGERARASGDATT